MRLLLYVLTSSQDSSTIVLSLAGSQIHPVRLYRGTYNKFIGVRLKLGG